jgi:hypothetical protein
LESVALVRLQHLIAQFDGTINVFAQKHGCADFTLDDVQTRLWVVNVKVDTFGANHDNDMAADA